eukprot:Amastigsp_a2667_5.p4 type:complete len:132 gc:universal Amastigsp_a2667_5:724-1119(+)
MPQVGWPQTRARQRVTRRELQSWRDGLWNHSQSTCAPKGSAPSSRALSGTRSCSPTRSHRPRRCRAKRPLRECGCILRPWGGTGALRSLPRSAASATQSRPTPGWLPCSAACMCWHAPRRASSSLTRRFVA